MAVQIGDGTVGHRSFFGTWRLGRRVPRRRDPAHCGPRLWKDRDVPRLNDGESLGKKNGGSWFGEGNSSPMRQFSSRSAARKQASALIAKIPPPLARHVAKVFRPEGATT